MSQSRQLAAIMFTDIVGYTKLMGEDEQKAFKLLKKNRSIQRPIIEKYNGRWLKEIGDGVLASFSTVTDAVYCAGTIQKTCESEPDLKLRIGIHEGEVVFEGDDVFGDGVNIASRLEPLAPIGGILVSESVHKNVTNKKGISSELVGQKELKGIKESLNVYQVEVCKPNYQNYEESIGSNPISQTTYLSFLYRGDSHIVLHRRKPYCNRLGLSWHYGTINCRIDHNTSVSYDSFFGCRQENQPKVFFEKCNSIHR